MDQGGYGAPPRAFGGADWLPAEGGLGEGPQMPYSMDGDGWPPDMGGMMPAQGGSGEGPQMLYSMEGDGWSPDMGGMMPCMPPHPLEAPYPFLGGHAAGMKAPHPFGGG